MSNGKVRLVIPRHNPINAITMGAIARDAGLSPEQFRALQRLGSSRSITISGVTATAAIRRFRS